jgi:PE family
MSSYVSAAPEMMTSAAADLATIGSDLSAAHTAAAASSVAVMPAAADEVSAAIAAVFGSYAQGYQTLAGRVAAFHDQFVQTLSAGAASYASTEAANDSVLRTVLHEIVFLQPLIQAVQTTTQAVEQGLLSLGQGLQSLGQSLQLAGEIMGTSGQGLGSLGQGLQDLGQSLQTLAQDLQQLPISGQQP